MDVFDVISLLLYLTAFGLGYVLGTVRSLRVGGGEDVPVLSRLRPSRGEERVRTAVKIDEKKFVTDVTETFRPAGDTQLGRSTEVVDDVGSAASRLAALKKKG